MKKKDKKKGIPKVRSPIPPPGPTLWHKDETKYTRKKKHKKPEDDQ